jgi:2-polyprenyl-3-methyl-5-hydroxy-6-metoxy-1,4-benzoquinol methylase
MYFLGFLGFSRLTSATAAILKALSVYSNKYCYRGSTFFVIISLKCTRYPYFRRWVPLNNSHISIYDMKHYFEANKRRWNELVTAHTSTGGYDVEGFLDGKNTLHSVELEEVGDVKGKSLLHLQCYFGLETLSWARLGGKVTGVDLSDREIALARNRG